MAPSENSSISTYSDADFKDRIVLPDIAIPEHYELKLSPDLNAFTCPGHVEIYFKIKNNPTNTLHLNAKDIKFGKVQATILSDDKSNNISPQLATRVEVDDNSEQVTFSFATALPANSRVSLSIEFTSHINDKLAGFYRSAYTGKDGQKKWMAVTQFEATDARRAFPCWDEPNKKSTFHITMEVDSSLVALSNMDIEQESQLSNNLKSVTFQKTPIMSTYLIAFIVGDLGFIETKNAHGVRVRVYAPSGSQDQGSFALDTGAKILDYFTEYFEIPYPLTKMDMVAIPDFASGAMENWGLVTYRTTALLLDSSQSSIKAKQRVAYVVAHELAHQWFGNLVTMDWWSDLWLNEGFATWVGWLATDKLFPKWQVWVDFVASDLQNALGLDSLRSSHPIEVPVRDGGAISQIFDAISYSKGASVIRMLQAYIGADDFQKGLRSYLKKHAYSNAKTTDLWSALGEASGKDVDAMMRSWTRQMGFPILNITERSDLTGITLTQHRFLSSGDAKSEEELLWQLPLNGISYHNNKQTSLSELTILDKKTTSFTSDSSTLDCYKFNHRHTAFYRTLYPPRVLSNLGTLISTGKLLPEDRLGLINDAFALGSAGYSSITEALSLLKHYDPSKENEYSIWTAISEHIGRIHSVWYRDEDVIKRLDGLRRSIFGPLASRLTWNFSPQENDTVHLLRVLALTVAGRSGVHSVHKTAKEQFDRRIQKGDVNAIHPNMFGPVLGLVVRFGGENEWDQVFNLYKKLEVADQKVAALSALTETRSTELIQKTLSLTLKEDHVRTQDLIYIFRGLAGNIRARKCSWEFVKVNWKIFYDRLYRGSLSLLSGIVGASTGGFVTEQDAKDVEHFFKEKDVSSIDRQINQALEKIRTASKWINRDDSLLKDWLGNNCPDDNEHRDL